MNQITIETSFSELKGRITNNITRYGTYIDSYYEDHILESKHYKVVIENTYAGYLSIFKEVMLTQFCLENAYLDYSRDVFVKLVKQNAFSEVYVSTSDKQLLNLALDFHKEIVVQDCIFEPVGKLQSSSGLSLVQATKADMDYISAYHDGFFQNLEPNIEQGQLYLGKCNLNPVSFGIIEKSKIFTNLASIGMFVIKQERGNNYGSMTILKLIEECQNQSINPVAGCFAKNTYSKNALHKAGMINTNKLLKIKVDKETA